ncbi:MAG: hypothetical protein AB7I44_21085 [Hyphomicrobiaceae bacterium]
MADDTRNFDVLATDIRRNDGTTIYISTVYSKQLGYTTYVFDTDNNEIDERLFAKTQRRAAYYHRIKVERHARTKMSDG